jgi:hypothetical protein
MALFAVSDWVLSHCVKGVPADDLLDSVFDEILDERAVKQIKACAPALRELFSASTDQRRTQLAILEGVARLVIATKHGDGMLKKTPAILMALYADPLIPSDTSSVL